MTGVLLAKLDDEASIWPPLVCGCCCLLSALFLITFVAVLIDRYIRRDDQPPDS